LWAIDVPHIPASWARASSMWDKLSNSGDTLKLMVPSYSRKTICGWSNYSDFFFGRGQKNKVTSHKMIENEMGYRGSKSITSLNVPQAINKLVIVKEQRVDGSWCINPGYGLAKVGQVMHLRCTLMGSERNYQAKTLSKTHINQIQPIRSYSTIVHTFNLENTILNNPWFITGFFDAEGSFSISLINKEGVIHCEARMAISLHKKDLDTLKCIQAYFNCKGSLIKHGEDSLQYVITSVDQLFTLVVPHFDNYPLVSKKYADYLLFRKAVLLIRNKEHLTVEGIQEIVSIKASMDKGLFYELQRAFPNKIEVPRPLVPDCIIPDPQWIAGFTSGEGCFMIKISKSPASKLGFGIQLIFQLTQNNRDEELMKCILAYFGCGKLVKNGTKTVFFVRKFSDIIDIIIPFFNNHKVVGVKLQDYLDWWKAASIVKVKGHLTLPGLEELKKIKAGMNRERV